MLVGACCCTSFEAVATDLDIHIVNDYFVAYVVDDDDSVTAVFVPTQSIGMLQTCLPLIASSLSICVDDFCAFLYVHRGFIRREQNN